MQKESRIHFYFYQLMRRIADMLHMPPIPRCRTGILAGCTV
jgi:hypothetical protein